MEKYGSAFILHRRKDPRHQQQLYRHIFAETFPSQHHAEEFWLSEVCTQVRFLHTGCCASANVIFIHCLGYSHKTGVYNICLTRLGSLYAYMMNGLNSRLGPVLQLMVKLSTWCRHQMETVSALLAICAGNSPVPAELWCFLWSAPE